MPAKDLTPEQMASIDRMHHELNEGTYYGLLSVPGDADTALLQKTYYELSRRWHPDRFFRKDLGEYADRLELVFVGVTNAYQTLRDPVKRKAYDRELREAGRVPGSSASPSSRRAPPPPSAPAANPEVPLDPTIPEVPDPSPAAREDRAPRARPGSIKERLDARRKTTSTVGAASRVRRHVEDHVRGQVQQQLTKARAFFEQGRADYQAGRFIKAAGALDLAVQFDPANQEYRALLDQAKRDSRGARTAMLIHQGEQAESYQQAKQAIQAYREAVALEPDSGKVYYRLAKLVRREEENDREALNLLRDAVLKDPEVIDYRLALGELYKELGLKLNARREFTEILKRDKGHEAAKTHLKDL